MDHLFSVIHDSFLWRWQSVWLAPVVRMSRRHCAWLGWCDETARSVTAKDLAYDISNGTFPLASVDHFAVSIVGWISPLICCLFSTNRVRGDWSVLPVYTSRPRANERSLLVQTKPSGRLILRSSVGSVVRLIHGELNFADPCRLGLSQKYEQPLVVSVDQS